MLQCHNRTRVPLYLFLKVHHQAVESSLHDWGELSSLSEWITPQAVRQEPLYEAQ
jgi:hypothetical protein